MEQKDKFIQEVYSHIDPDTGEIVDTFVYNEKPLPKVYMWEILVPTSRNDGRYIKTRFHKVWDAKVREITGGLTILPVNKGQWVSPSGQLFLERMIPVRISCTREQIERIIQMTLKYYEQEAVLAYLISETVLIRYAKK